MKSWRGYTEFKPRVYLRDRGQGRNDEQMLLKAELEFDFQFDDGRSAYFRPRVYIDLLDGSDNRFDPYEAYATLERKDWDLRAGQFVENWGIVDTYNPIDVVNRRDLGTDFLTADRLGELGLRLRKFYKGGETVGEPTISLYAIPIWQATRFPTEDHRFGFGAGALQFDEDAAFKPSGAERGFYAGRFQSTLNSAPLNADLQLMASYGPERLPGIALNTAGDLVPAYFGATTVGAGVRAVPNEDALGAFLATLTLKAEVVYKAPYSFDATPFDTPDDYIAFVLGVDRFFYDVLRDQDTLTVMVEYARESGAQDSTAALRIFQNDLVLRGLWEANNFARTSLELRGIFDLEQDESITEAIFERQLRSLHEDLKLIVQFQYYRAESGSNTLLGTFPDNTSLAVGLRWDF